MVTAEIIAAGTELTSGQKLDTNSQWLASELRDLGIETRFHTTVGDAMADNLLALQLAVERSDVVLFSGGLGPTQDDITREVIAELLGEPLVMDDDALAELQAYFAGRGRPMPERNRVQAMRPSSAIALPNSCGTAPGILARYKRADGRSAVIAAMPGVPSEMRQMFRQQVVHQLPQSGRINVLRLVHCYGLGESAVEEMLGEMTKRDRNPEVGITASSATITLRVLAQSPSQEESEALADADVTEICSALGSIVFGFGNDTLESVVVQTLSDRKQTLATAESGSGGVILGLLARAARYEEVYNGGFTVPPAGDDELLGETPLGNPFCEARAVHLAKQVRDRLKTDYGVAAVCNPVHLGTAIAQKEADAFIALASDGGVSSARINLLGNPAIHGARIAKTALNMLRLKLME